MLDGYVARGDVAGCACFEKSLFEGQICFRNSDKQAIIQFQEIRHDLAQVRILIDTLDGGFLVRYTIAAASVEQAMIAPGRPRGHFSALNDGDAQAAQR
jgi:hypothetical protein